MPVAENITLEVFNVTGQKVATILDDIKTAGKHEILFDASNLSSGIYFYRLTTPGLSITRKMFLLR